MYYGFSLLANYSDVKRLNGTSGVDTYRAVHRLTSCFRCLKRVEADNSRGLERLEKEEGFLRYIRNELVVSFWDNWVEFGSHFFEFDWCVGGRIVDYFRHGTENGSPKWL